VSTTIGRLAIAQVVQQEVTRPGEHTTLTESRFTLTIRHLSVKVADLTPGTLSWPVKSAIYRRVQPYCEGLICFALLISLDHIIKARLKYGYTLKNWQKG
jgi:hypothetical protein